KLLSYLRAYVLLIESVVYVANKSVGDPEQAEDGQHQPPAERAVGYSSPMEPTWRKGPLPHGAFGAMGGLLTTAAYLGKYVAFHLSAWRAPDDAESGAGRPGEREHNGVCEP